MKPANDPSIDYRLLVKQGYDTCAATYEAIREKEVEPDLVLLMDKLDDDAKVMDIGCGAGVPIARALAQRFVVKGIDVSKEMVLLSRKNVPGGTFIHADIMSVDLPDSHFDAVVAFYSIFHLPREEHEDLFHRIHRWIKSGGYLLVTVSEENEAPYTEDYLGVTMYWSNYGMQEYLDMLDEVGFSVLSKTSVGHGYHASHETPEEHHLLIFAQKI
jgi:cyclopropane fatty-acyl-phospholipid synthase-like methyltransferase